MDPITWLADRLFLALEERRLAAVIAALSLVVARALGLSFAALAGLLYSSGANAYSVGSLACFSAASFAGAVLCRFVLIPSK